MFRKREKFEHFLKIYNMVILKKGYLLKRGGGGCNNLTVIVVILSNKSCEFTLKIIPTKGLG